MYLYHYITKSKRTIILLWMVLAPLLVFAQLYSGFNSSNYAGIAAATHNPAALSNNPYRFDVVFLGVNAFAANNYGYIKRNGPLLSDPDFDGDLIRDNKTKYGVGSLELMVPSFMIRLKNGASIGLTNRARTYLNASGLTGDLANVMADGFDNSELFDEQFSNQTYRIDLHSWREHAITYAWMLDEQIDRKIKAGVTAKLLFGNGAGFVNFATPNFTNVGTKLLYLPDFLIEYGYSDNFDGISDNDYKWKRGNKMNFGFDIGVQFEHYDAQRGANPSQNKLIEDYNKQTNFVAQYKYRIGIALLDIGRIKYQLGASSGTASRANTAGDIIDLDRFDGTWDDPQLVEDSLSAMVDLNELSGKYTAGLPTVLKTDIDYNLRNGFYLNTSMQINLNKLKWANTRIGDISNITVTPRFEKHWVGFYAPIYLNIEGQLTLGAAMHVGPLVLGIHNISPIISKSEVTNEGVYLMLKTFIGTKKISSRGRECGPRGWQKGEKTKTKRPLYVP